MTRLELQKILQEETDSFNESSRLRDNVLDAMEIAYIKGKKQQCNIDLVSQRSELLDFKEWWNNLPDECDDKLYMTNETIDRYLKSYCG